MKITDTFQHQNIQVLKFGSFPFGAPRIFVHAYFIDGLLIDTAHPNIRKEAMNIFKKLPIEQVFITHHHEDHSGNIQALQDHFKCPTFASKKCIEIMKKPPKLSFAQHITWGDRPPNFQLQPIENELKTTNYTFEIIPIPGHAIDMIALYERTQGWLFSADLYVHHRIKLFMQPESMKQQIESLERVLKLDFETMFCSHNPQFKNPKALLAKKLAYFQDFYGRAAALYNQGDSPRVIFKKMNLQPRWQSRIMTGGTITALNMVKSVIRDEKERN